MFVFCKSTTFLLNNQWGCNNNLGVIYVFNIKYLQIIHHPEHTVAHCKAGGQHHGRQVFAVDGKKDECQTGREGQQEKQQSPKVEAETVVRGMYDIHFQLNIKDNDANSRKLC